MTVRGSRKVEGSSRIRPSRIGAGIGRGARRIRLAWPPGEPGEAPDWQVGAPGGGGGGSERGPRAETHGSWLGDHSPNSGSDPAGVRRAWMSEGPLYDPHLVIVA
jgi:hypothetical protein